MRKPRHKKDEITRSYTASKRQRELGSLALSLMPHTVLLPHGQWKILLLLLMTSNKASVSFNTIFFTCFLCRHILTIKRNIIESNVIF